MFFLIGVLKWVGSLDIRNDANPSMKNGFFVQTLTDWSNTLHLTDGLSSVLFFRKIKNLEKRMILTINLGDICYFSLVYFLVLWEMKDEKD